MNQTDINKLIAQQQAAFQNAMQTNHQVMWGAIALQIAFLLIGAVVTYLFYARLRDISVEIRKFRIAYELANTEKAQSSGRSFSHTSSAENPFGKGDSKYMPKG